MLVWSQVCKNPSSFPLVVSYFTDEFYQREAFELARSCQTFGLEYHIQQVRDLGDWRENTNTKPSFLQSMMKMYPERDILWLDADARVRDHPELLLKIQAPIAFRMFPGDKPGSGTVFLRAGSRALLEEWLLLVKRHPHHTDQVCMGTAVKKLGISPFLLPQSYCWIFDEDSLKRSGGYYNPMDSTPVIEHMQASRWTRRKRIK